MAQWRIFMENKSDYWGLWTVTFPFVNGFPEVGKYDIARSTFGNGGHLLRNWKEKIEGRYPSGNWPMQFLALNQNKNAVYFASMDAEARAKDFLVEPGEKLAIIHYVENMGITGSDFPDYYPIAFGVYQGGWLEAAQRYRGWALKQKWAQASKLSQHPDVPDIIKNAGLWLRGDWVWNGKEGSPSEMNLPILQVQESLGVPVALHWYNWHGTKFDNLYPHFSPPGRVFPNGPKSW